MSEVSLSSSPSKSDCTKYTTRLKRLSNRFKSDLCVQINSHQETKPDIFRNLLNDFYNDYEGAPTKTTATENKSKSLLENTAILRNFKPFELERSLLMADNIFVQQLSPIKANPFPETQGFVSCTNLSQVNNNPQCYSTNGSQNTSFIITETELINVCHQAEKVIGENDFSRQYQPLHEATPKKNCTTALDDFSQSPLRKDNTALVNSILEDFSQSPLRKEQIITNYSWQHTPEFRLRRLPVKNYSRKYIKCTRIKFTQGFADHDPIQSSEYDENASFCSSLSIQEDDTFCENQNNQSIATPLNNTERLCENLLNLTEYFTQNELMENFEGDPRSVDDLESSRESTDLILNLQKISDLLDNILTLRSKYTNEQINDSYESSDDFNGFSNNISNEDPDCNLHYIRHSNKEDNFFLEDWNEEDCHDIFACINTENVLQQNNKNIPFNKSNNITIDDSNSKYTKQDQTSIVLSVPTSNAAVSNLIACKTDSSKTTEVLKDPLPNCDNKAFLKDDNIFKSPEDYEWNDDCDFFLNFQTPISYQENFVTNIHQKLPTLPALSQQEQYAPTTSKLATLGFTTAAGKNVHITSKGQATIQNLLNEFAGEINTNKNYEEELKEIKFKAYAKTHNLTTGPSTLSVKNHFNKDYKLRNTQDAPCTISTEKNSRSEFNADAEQITEEGFELARLEGEPPADQTHTSTHTGIHVDLKQQTKKTFNLESKSNEISTKTQNSMKKLVEEPADILVEEFLAQSEFIENVLNTEGDQQNDDDDDTKKPLLFGNHSLKTDHLSVGFQTANGKQVSISREAKRIAEAFLKEFNADVDIEKDLKDIKTKVQLKKKDFNPTSSHITNNVFANPVLLNPSINKGFQTANDKDIFVSTQAKQSVASLLKDFNRDLDVEICEKNLKDLKANVLNKNKDIRPKTLSPKLVEDIVRQNLDQNNDLSKSSNQLDEGSEIFSQNITINKVNENVGIGFQTANGKQVSISKKAKQAVANLFKEFNAAVDVETYELYLKDVKMQMQNKNQDLRAKSNSQLHKENSATVQPGDHFSHALINSKRKMSIDDSDLETSDKTPAAKMFKNDLQCSKSLLAEQSLKSPLTSVTRPIIVRKNLLSLTKKRKTRGNMLDKPPEDISEQNKDLNDLKACTATPTKSDVFMKSKEPAPDTPDLKEFLSKPSLTSTPRTNTPQSSAQTFEDCDLKPIIWKDDSSFCNISQSSSLCATKLSECMTSNISFNSPNPTAKDRIGRLKMYGKAPDVSPILIETNHNCRPSGLRRGRSMLKKTKN